MNINKLLSWITIFFVIFYSCSTTVFATTQYFTVTAYYSPLPDQKYYLKWDYDAERRLNGMWIRWASGRAVFSGMIAAPKNYQFGTKVYLQWLWVWDIQDRGWAIVNAWERWYKHDRLDVWMWYGDEGLRRALAWGKRTIPWYIASSSAYTTINVDNIAAPSWAVASLKPQQSLFETSVWLSSSTKDINELQERLKEMWLYNGEVDGNYRSIMDIIYDYQIEKKIITWVYSPGAWYTGPKTRKQLKNDYFDYMEKKIFEEKRKKYLEDRFEQLETSSAKKANTQLANIWTPKFWEVSHRVRSLQVLMKELWYFDHKDTAIFGNITKQSIIAYQIERQIISHENDLGAGNFWPNTKAAIKEDLETRYLSTLVENDESVDVVELVKFGIYEV